MFYVLFGQIICTGTQNNNFADMELTQGLALAPQIIKLGLPIWQMIQANKLDTTRPMMPIPTEAKAALNLTRTTAGQEHAAGYSDTLQNFQTGLGATNNAIGRTATGSGQGLEALVAANAGVNQNIAQLGAMDEVAQEERRRILGDELNNMAKWKHLKWGWDEQEKFLANAAAKSALTGAAIHNTSNTLDNISSTLISGKMFDAESAAGTGGGGEAGATGGGAFGLTPEQMGQLQLAMKMFGGM